jgi:hypothetical protein
MKVKHNTWLLSLPLTLVLGASSPVSQGSPIDIFGTPAPSPLETDTDTPINVGVKFWSTQAGSISAIRFYRATTNPRGYIAGLYTASGSLLGSVAMQTESGPVPGWQVANFATPISISANTTYVAAYYVPDVPELLLLERSSYQLVAYGLTNAVTNGPLTAPAGPTVGNGVYLYGLRAFPNTASARNTNFLVDVLFTPAATTPYLTLTFNPPNPSIASNAPAGTVVATITASWSDGSPFTGTFSFGPPDSNDGAAFAISGNQLIVNPSGPGLSGDGNTTQNVTIVAAQ